MLLNNPYVSSPRWHLFFFFFQAEDGIRDVAVTGVQTCALPISTLPGQPVQIVVAPESVALDPYQTQQFRASGRTAAGDTMPVTVSWTASAGPVTQSGLYTADTSVADVLVTARSEEHTSELQSRLHLVCRLLL